MAKNLPSVSWPLKKWRKTYNVFPDLWRSEGIYTTCILTSEEMVKNLPNVSWPLKKWRKIYQEYPDPLRIGGKSIKCSLTSEEVVEYIPSVSWPLKKWRKIYKVYPDLWRNDEKSTKSVLIYIFFANFIGVIYASSFLLVCPSDIFIFLIQFFYLCFMGNYVYSFTLPLNDIIQKGQSRVQVQWMKITMLLRVLTCVTICKNEN